MSHECKWKRAFVDNSLLILIKGNQNGGAVVFYRSVFTWLPILLCPQQLPLPPTPIPAPPHPDRNFLAPSGLLQLGLIKTKKVDGYAPE